VSPASARDDLLRIDFTRRVAGKPIDKDGSMYRPVFSPAGARPAGDAPAALDLGGAARQGAPHMSDTDPSEIPGTPRRKHRHDLGHEDHGPKLAAGTTRAIQSLLGLWIALTLGLVVYAMIDGSQRRSEVTAPAPAAETAR